MEVSNPQVEEITRHHFYTLDELESLLQSLWMELEVAPTDHKAHRDLFSRIIKEAERGLGPPDPKTKSCFSHWFLTRSLFIMRTETILVS